HLVGRVPELLELAVDDVIALLAGPETITIARGPVVLAAPVRDRHVVPGVEDDEALRMIDDPHAHRDRDIPRLLLRDAGDQVRDGEGAEHPARRPVQSL